LISNSSGGIGYLGGNVDGPIYADYFSIPSRRNHAPEWNQTFLSATNSSWSFLPADGFLGLAFSTIANPGTKTVMETLMQLSHRLLAEPRFAIYYGRELTDTGASPGDGALTLGGSHEDRFVEGDLTWVDVELEFAEFELWRTNAVSIVGTTGVGTSSGAHKVTTDLGFAWAVFDTGAGLIEVPTSAVEAVYGSIGMNYTAILHDHVIPRCSDFNDTWSITFMLGDESNPTPITITGSQLQQTNFAGQGDNACWPPISDSGYEGLTLIGSQFLQQFYTVFDFGAYDVASYKPRIGFGELKREWKPMHPPSA
jgi:saccharopepsin